MLTVIGGVCFSTDHHDGGSLHALCFALLCVRHFSQGELELMKQYREGREIVLTKVPYWML